MANKLNRIKNIIGIEFTQNSINIAHLARNGREPELNDNIIISYTYDLYSDSPELIGQEIKQHLQTQNILSQHCIVVLPNQSILKHRFVLPDLKQDDLENFINLQIERLFPYQIEDISVSKILYTVGTEQHVLLCAVPLKLVDRIIKICNYAGIHLFSITTGYPESTDSKVSTQLYLRYDNQNLDFYALHQNNLIAFRTFNIQLDPDNHEHISFSNFIRELKITITELPFQYLTDQNTIYLEGFQVLSTEEKDLLSSKLDLLDLTPIFIESIEENDIKLSSPLIGATFRYYFGKGEGFNFLPPKIHPFQSILRKISSKRNVYIISGTTTIFLLILFTLVMQSMKLNHLKNKWMSIENKVEELEILQNNIKQFRPWYDSSKPNLRRLLVMSRLFPEEGSVWVKNIKIEDLNLISCTGYARNNQNLLMVLDQINQAEQIAELQVQQVQGENPIQFAVKMNWIEG